MWNVRFASFAACAIMACGLSLSGSETALALNEKETGDQYHQQLSKKYKVYKDARVTEAGRKASEAAGAYDVEFYAIDMGKDDQPNAFQIPNHIYATKSLLNVMDDVGLTFIMSHEMGHQVGHHLAKQSKKNQTVGIGAALLGAIFGVGSNSIGGYAINIAGGAIVNNYSREQEQEADLFGLEAIHDMGIPFAKAAESFKKLGGSTGGSRTLNSLFGSHPMMKDRIDRAAKADEWLFMRATDIFSSGKQRIAVVWPYMIEKPLPDSVKRMRENLKTEMARSGYRGEALNGKAPVWAKMHRLEELVLDDARDVAKALDVDRLVVQTSYGKKNMVKGAVLDMALSRKSTFDWQVTSAESLSQKIRAAVDVGVSNPR